MSEMGMLRQLRRKGQDNAKFFPFRFAEFHPASNLVEAALFRDEAKKVDALLTNWWK